MQNKWNMNKTRDKCSLRKSLRLNQKKNNQNLSYGMVLLTYQKKLKRSLKIHQTLFQMESIKLKIKLHRHSKSFKDQYSKTNRKQNKLRRIKPNRCKVKFNNKRNMSNSYYSIKKILYLTIKQFKSYIQNCLNLQ